nr:hypothetical protein [Tanacetum cinerariifolium]
ATSRYPAINNQLRTSSNPRQQAIINNGRVTILPIQGRQNSMSAGSSRPFASGSGGASGKQRVIVCYNCKGRIVPLFDTMLVPQGEGSGTLTEPYHTPSPEAQHTSHTTPSSPTIPFITTTPIPPVTSSDTPPIRQYTRRTRIAQSSILPPTADEPASPLRDVSQGEACPTDSGFIADQDRETIAKSSTLPHDSAPRVTSPVADEGTQEVEINRLKARVKLLEDREGVAAERSRDDASIKGRNLDEGEAAAKRVSDDTEEMATILTSMDAATVLASGVAEVPTCSGSIPTASPPATEVPTGSDVVPTASLVFATATVVTPYRRRKGKEVMVESETPKKQKVQEQIDALVARELEEQMEEAERFKRKGTRFEQESTKKLKTSEEVLEEGKSPDEFPKEKDLNQLWRVVKESLSNRPPTSDKEMELWVELNSLYEPDEDDQLDKEIFMLVEKDYPLRKGLAIVMISYKLQVENYSRMADDLILKIFKIASTPRQQVIEFPLAEEVPTARRKEMPLPRGLHYWESVP